MLNDDIAEFLNEAAAALESRVFDPKGLAARFRAKAKQLESAPVIDDKKQIAECNQLIREFAEQHVSTPPAHLRRKNASYKWTRARLTWKPVMDYGERDWPNDQFAGQNPHRADDPRHSLWEIFSAAPTRRMPTSIKAFQDILDKH